MTDEPIEDLKAEQDRIIREGDVTHVERRAVHDEYVAGHDTHIEGQDALVKARDDRDLARFLHGMNQDKLMATAVRPLRWLIYLAAVLFALNISTDLYFRYIDQTPQVEFTNSPFPVLNESYKPGQTVRVHATFKVRTIGTLKSSLFLLPIDAPGAERTPIKYPDIALASGSIDSDSPVAPLPIDTKPGTYILKCFCIFDTGAGERTVTWETQPFTVVAP